MSGTLALRPAHVREHPSRTLGQIRACRDLEEYLEPARRDEVVVSAPSILAGIGVLAHHAVPQLPRRDTG